MAKANLIVNLPKCEFGEVQLTYLGHHVGRGVVLPGLAKLEAIVHFPVPQTHRQVMHILVMYEFYYKFLPNFAVLTKGRELSRNGLTSVNGL